MSKSQIGVIKNDVGGIDLVTQGKDQPRYARIHTGNSKESLQYWSDLKQTAEVAINKLKASQTVHIIVVGDNGYAKRSYITTTAKR